MRHRNPHKKTFYGVGSMGDGPFGWADGHAGAYNRWCGMLQRCYAPTTNRVALTYAGCSVEDQWLVYQDFAAWFVQQEHYLDKTFQIDKDLLVPGNRVYGPDQCCLIPSRLNYALRVGESGSKHGTGVKILPSGRFEARTKRDGKYVYLGLSDSAEEAHLLWAHHHSQYLLELGDELLEENLISRHHRAMVAVHADLFITKARKAFDEKKAS